MVLPEGSWSPTYVRVSQVTFVGGLVAILLAWGWRTYRIRKRER